jgi:Ca-activated chloride channel family protein
MRDRKLLAFCLLMAFGLQSCTHDAIPKNVEFGIAYGTEKRDWLIWAVEQFKLSPEGKHIHVNLIPMGSLEGARAILGGDDRIQVWSPASAAYKSTFVEHWQAKYGSDPIVKEAQLALTPIVFVMWEERYQKFTDHYGTVDFDTINRALHELGGWRTIGNHPEWGLFKFGQTNPGFSNSGILSLLLAGHSYFRKTDDLTLEDITDVHFEKWLQRLETASITESNSTGNLMQDMVRYGPSYYDAVLVYESVAIDQLQRADNRWGPIHVIYPEYNLWNDNPYYILNNPWTSDEQRKAAEAFLDFLLTKEIQQGSIIHGFRPANPDVSTSTADSPWVRYQNTGLKLDLGKMCAPPGAEIIHNLSRLWSILGQDRLMD